MAFLVGISLIPFGALFGIVFVVALASFPSSASLPIETFPSIIPIAAGFGTLFAAPVTAIALPAAYGIVRRYGALNTTKLAVAGMTSGFIPILAFAAAEWSRKQKLDFDMAAGTVSLCIVSAVAGLLAGILFALIMRRLRPGHWNSKR